MKAAGLACAMVMAAGVSAAQVPVGDEFIVNTYTPDYQQRSRLAVQPGGAFVVVWQSFSQDGDGYAVVGQRFDARGQRLGGEFQANTTTTDYQSRPVVASDARGNFVVAWQSFLQDGSAYGVFAQRFDAGGGRRGGEFQVNTFTTAIQYRPALAVAPGGAFMVVWTSGSAANQDGAGRAVAARFYDASGAARGADFVVNSYTTEAQYGPAITVDGAGNFVVGWNDASGQDGSARGVEAQRFGPLGQRLGGEFRVNTSTTGNQYLWHSGLAAAADGSFVAAYGDYTIDGDGPGIAAQRFDAAGARLGAELAVNTFAEGTQRLAAVGSDVLGNFVVTWESLDQDLDGFGVFGQRFANSGARRGDEFAVNTFTPANQFRSAAGSDAVGNFVVTWTTYALQDGSSSAAMARRFGGLQPQVLRVDTGGNGVFEMNETVDMRPTWRNGSGSAQTVGGSLSSFTGPPGQIYSIVDGGGSYGTVADGASAACTDCYTLTVTTASPRPLHLDATVVEALSPETQGQQKRWTLHVGTSFVDVHPTSPFYRFVETLLHSGATGGCTANAYCPVDPATRAQMAVFVLIGREGLGYTPPACTTPVFADVPAASPFCRYVEELARRGVVSGCGGGNYCPNDATTREQMAVFVLRTLDPTLQPPLCTTPVFNDVPAASPFCRWIEELARRGVVSGCGGGAYCPTDPVSREQMAVFIAATFGLSLYGP